MLCALRPTGPIETASRRNHSIWSHSVSTLFANDHSLSRFGPRTADHDHQSNSWLGLLDRWLARSEVMHQRAALREIADDPHMLKDLGLTREEALEHANRPFWR